MMVSTLRAATSRANGKLSMGPVTSLGKKASSMNAVRTGLCASAVLLPDETVSEYEHAVETWTETLKPSSPGEAELVARVADLNFRLGRLRRHEDKLLSEALEARLTESGAYRAWASAKGCLETTQKMVEIFTTISCDLPVAEVLGLIGAAQELLKTLSVLLDGHQVHQPLSAAIGTLKEKSEEEETIPPALFADVALAASSAIQALLVKAGAAEVAVNTERDILAASYIELDEVDQRKVDRHRQVLNRQLDAELARLKVLRELPTASGSFCSPIRVELKVIGRRNTEVVEVEP